MIAITRDITEPIQMGYHPMNVKSTEENSATNGTETSGLRPFVAIKTVSIRAVLKIREIITPACVAVTPIAAAILARYSDQIILIKSKRRGGDILNLHGARVD